MRKNKIAMVSKNLEINGITSVIYNYCTNMPLNLVEITIFCGNPINNMIAEDLKQRNILIEQLPSKKNLIKYVTALIKKLKKHKYDMIYVHGNSSMISLELFCGFLSGIKKRAAHSHNTTCGNKMLHILLKPLFNLLCNKRFACGEDAGKWLYNKKDFYVVQNAIDIDKFKYDASLRNKFRSELDIKNEIVIGHIGRINDQKNQEYLIKVFEELCDLRSNYKLLIVGTGPYKEKIENIVKNSRYKDKIILYGETNSPKDIYMAMDLFVFPSKYEGLPVTLVESQISGVECVISDVITDEVILSDRVTKLSILDEPKKWAECIIKIDIKDREKYFKKIKNNFDSFDIKICSEKFEQELGEFKL